MQTVILLDSSLIKSKVADEGNIAEQQNVL